jgi:tetratricopeptide (TPR) repeat protein
MLVLKLSIVLLSCVGLAAAQAPPSRPSAPEDKNYGSIRGRVAMPNGAPLAAAVKVSVTLSRGTQTFFYTDQQGQFEVASLRPGFYTLEVETGSEHYEVRPERVEVYREGMTTVTLLFREKGKAPEGDRPAGRTVSAGELHANVPAKARKEFERAGKAAGEGKAQEAVEALRRAIQIHPGYMMAHNDLGTLLLGLGKLDEAADSLRTAAGLDPNAFSPQLNLGIVLVHQQKFAEAAAALDRALSLDGSSAAARLYAGQAFAALGETERAVRELKAAYHTGGAKYASALFHLGQLHMREGNSELARQAFEAYLKEAPGAANAEQVRRLMGMLR